MKEEKKKTIVFPGKKGMRKNKMELAYGSSFSSGRKEQKKEDLPKKKKNPFPLGGGRCQGPFPDTRRVKKVPSPLPAKKNTLKNRRPVPSEEEGEKVFFS